MSRKIPSSPSSVVFAYLVTVSMTLSSGKMRTYNTVYCTHGVNGMSGQLVTVFTVLVSSEGIMYS